jgi:small neutral amino acid transporter SnatA (MarC family)
MKYSPKIAIKRTWLALAGALLTLLLGRIVAHKWLAQGDADAIAAGFSLVVAAIGSEYQSYRAKKREKEEDLHRANEAIRKLRQQPDSGYRPLS